MPMKLPLAELLRGADPTIKLINLTTEELFKMFRRLNI
jgi:hypothetical protein